MVLTILFAPSPPSVERKKIKQDMKYTEISLIDEFAEKLSSKSYSSREYQFAEENLKEEINKKESIQQNTPVVLLILSSLYLYFFEYMMGISAQKIIDSVPKTFKGLSFIVVITAIFPLLLKLDYFSDLKFQKQALAALRKAQILKENVNK